MDIINTSLPAEFRIRADSFNTAYITGNDASDDLSIQTYINDDIQLWSFDRVSDGFYIVNKKNGKVITADKSGANNKPLKLVTRTGSPYERWYSVMPQDKIYNVLSLPTNQYMGLVGIELGSRVSAQYLQQDPAFQPLEFEFVTVQSPPIYIKERENNLLFNTSTEGGYTYIVLTENKGAIPTWNFIYDQVSSNDITYNFRIMESNSKMVIAPVNIKNTLYLTLTSDMTGQDSLFRVSRSGFGSGFYNYELSMFYMTNIVTFKNIWITGGAGSKLILNNQSPNNKNQKFQLVPFTIFN